MFLADSYYLSVNLFRDFEEIEPRDSYEKDLEDDEEFGFLLKLFLLENYFSELTKRSFGVLESKSNWNLSMKVFKKEFYSVLSETSFSSLKIANFC